MTDPNDLERRIKERFTAGQEQQRLERERVRQTMCELEARCHRYTMLADRLMQDIIRPRMEHLARCFENAAMPAERLSRHSAVVEFARTPRYPATTSLEFRITRDSEARVLMVEHKFQIIPAYLAFEGEDKLCGPVEEVKDEEVAAWVEAKVLAAVDTYLRLETEDHYQDTNRVSCPVCRMQFHKSLAAAEAEHDGRTYYFCVPACRDKFVENPQRYLARGAAPEAQL
jgi:YHS domain-containing protein